MTAPRSRLLVLFTGPPPRRPPPPSVARFQAAQLRTHLTSALTPGRSSQCLWMKKKGSYVLHSAPSPLSAPTSFQPSSRHAGRKRASATPLPVPLLPGQDDSCSHLLTSHRHPPLPANPGFCTEVAGGAGRPETALLRGGGFCGLWVPPRPPGLGLGSGSGTARTASHACDSQVTPRPVPRPLTLSHLSFPLINTHLHDTKHGRRKFYRMRPVLC